MHKILPVSLFVMGSVIPLLATASISSFQTGIKQSEAYRQTIQQQISDFDPASVLKDFSANPAESHYYQGDTRSGDQGMANDASRHLLQDAAGKLIVSARDQRPIFHINKKEEGIQKSLFIANHADHIARGISDDKVNCHHVEQCHTTYEDRVCKTQTSGFLEQCTKTSSVKIKTQVLTLTGPLYFDRFQNATIQMSQEGEITGVRVRTSITGELFGAKPAAYLNDTAIPYQDGTMLNPTFESHSLHLMVHQGDQLTFGIRGYESIFSTLHDSEYTVWLTVKKPDITWSKVCANL